MGTVLPLSQGPSELRPTTPKWDSMWQTFKKAEGYQQHSLQVITQRSGMGQEGPTLEKETSGKCTNCCTPFVLILLKPLSLAKHSHPAKDA